MRALLAAALLLTPASASAMSVAQFLGKARVLQAQGPLAVLSPDYDLLRREVRAIVAVYRADLASARGTGRPPHSCPPPGGMPRLTADQMLAALERIPPAQRGMSMKAAFYAYMKRRYPCR
jgi:hypothetical protein